MKVKKQVLACALTCCVAGAALSGVVWDGHSANGGGMQVGYLIAKNMAKGSDVDEDELTTRLTVGGSVAGTLVGGEDRCDDRRVRRSARCLCGGPWGRPVAPPQSRPATTFLAVESVLTLLQVPDLLRSRAV